MFFHLANNRCWNSAANDVWIRKRGRNFIIRVARVSITHIITCLWCGDYLIENHTSSIYSLTFVMGLRTTSNQQRRRLWFVISVIELNKNYGHFFISSTVDRNDYGVCELWNGFSSFHVYRYGAAIWKTDTLLNYTDIHLKRNSSIVYWNIHGNCLWKWSAQCFFRFSHRNCQYYSSSFSSSIFSVQCLSIFRSVYCYLLIVDTDTVAWHPQGNRWVIIWWRCVFLMS